MADRGQKSSGDPRFTRSRTALQAALLDLIAATGFEGVTAAAIAQRAGVGYATFFRHYPDPLALLLEVADGLIAEAGAVIAPAALAGNDLAIAHALVGFVQGNRPVCHALLVGAGEPVRRAVTDRALTVARAMPFAPGLPPALALVHGVGATLTILGWWLAEGDDGVDIAAILVALVLAPLRHGTGR